jgi:hypothetical protein
LTELQTVNDYLELESYDNTKIDLGDDVMVENFTESFRQTVPNELRQNGVRYWHNSFDVIKNGNHHIVHKDSIFAKKEPGADVELLNPGVLAYQDIVSQEYLGAEVRRQNFFVVAHSGIDDIKEGHIVVVRPQAFVRVNIDNRRMYYIQPDNIILHAGDHKTNPGPSYSMYPRHEFNGLMIKKGAGIISISRKSGEYCLCKTSDILGVI